MRLKVGTLFLWLALGCTSITPGTATSTANQADSSAQTENDTSAASSAVPPRSGDASSELLSPRDPAPRPASTLPPVPPPILQAQDPCGVLDCEAGRGCCHNPLASQFNVFPREFLVDCLPEPRGDVNAVLDPSCAEYTCETDVRCLWKGCRMPSGECGVWADELQVLGPEHGWTTFEMNWGCVDERWLIRRNASGVPPDPTLQCALDYWWADAGVRDGGT